MQKVVGRVVALGVLDRAVRFSYDHDIFAGALELRDKLLHEVCLARAGWPRDEERVAGAHQFPRLFLCHILGLCLCHKPLVLLRGSPR